MSEINPSEKIKSVMSIFMKIQFWIILGVSCGLSYVISLTDAVHVSISGPVLMSFFSFAYIDWEKEKKNLTPLLILILGTLLFVFTSQKGDVETESRMNILNYCIAEIQEGESIKACVRNENDKYAKQSKLKIYIPKRPDLVGGLDEK